MAGNIIHVQGSYIDIHDNEVVNLSVDKGEVKIGDNKQVKTDENKYPTAMLVERVEQVRDLFWGNSSMTVIFCVCRDCYGYVDNMSQFERDFGCKPGLLSNTFGDNPYMQYHVDSWETRGVKDRVLRLVEAYKKAVAKKPKA